VLHDKLWIKLDDLDSQVPDGIDVTKMIEEEREREAYVFAFVYEEDTSGATSPLNLLASVSASVTSLASDAYNLRGEVAPEVSSSDTKANTKALRSRSSDIILASSIASGISESRSSSFTHSLASTHALASDGLDAPSPPLLDSAPASVDDSEVEVVQLEKDYSILELGDIFNVRSLTMEETNEWNKIFSGDENEIVAEKRGIQLTKKDLRRFKSGKWLNDACIDFFLAMINELGLPGLFFFSSGFLTGTNLDTFNFNLFFFSSGFLTKMLGEQLNTFNFELVEKWAHKLIHGQKTFINIFDEKYLLAPLNYVEEHWALLVVCVKEKTIVYMDSGGTNPKEDNAIRGIKRYLAEFATERVEFATNKGLAETKWEVVKNPVGTIFQVSTTLIFYSLDLINHLINRFTKGKLL
jgi:hypothetical protein